MSQEKGRRLDELLKERPEKAQPRRPSYLMLLADRQIFGWAMYDWANSSFSTIVVSALLGPYMAAIAKGSGKITLLSFHVEPDAIYPFFLSISVALQLVLLPGLGAVADARDCKRSLLVLLASLGSILTCLMGIVTKAQGPSSAEGLIMANGFLFVFANLCFGSSVTLYNSFLPEIAPKRLSDRVSALGWAAGYLGGGLALALCLILFWMLGQGDKSIRISFVIAGLWWLIFTLWFPARLLRRDKNNRNRCYQKGHGTTKLFLKPFRTLFSMRKQKPDAWRFLLAYFFYNDGVQTVIAVASIFAVSTLGLRGVSLLVLILFIQFVAIFGAVIFGWLSDKMGTKRAISFSLLLWMVILVYACLFLEDRFGLFMVAFIMAMVLGGTQALSRSLFSRLLPANNEAEYFGFYEVSEKGSSTLGPLVFAAVVQLTGDSSLALLSLGVFFLLGLWMLKGVRV